MIFIYIVLIFCLAFICYQDLKYRAVYWFCFPVLAAIMFTLKFKLTGSLEALTQAAYGIAFLVVQLAILWIYFSLKKRSIINLTNDYLGWGDVLFLAAITCYLSPINFIIFYVVSLIAVLLYTLIATLLSDKSRNPHIPLAGLQAALLAPLMVFDFVYPNLMLYDDTWLYL